MGYTRPTVGIWSRRPPCCLGLRDVTAPFRAPYPGVPRERSATAVMRSALFMIVPLGCGGHVDSGYDKPMTTAFLSRRRRPRPYSSLTPPVNPWWSMQDNFSILGVGVAVERMKRRRSARSPKPTPFLAAE